MRNDSGAESWHLHFCGHVVRGALAGNGGEMAEVEQALKAKKSTSKKRKLPSRKPRSKTGGKAKKGANTKAPQENQEELDSVDEVCGDGAGQLREAANRELVKRSSNIAEKLAELAEDGSTSCTKILVDLSEGKKPSPAKIRKELTLAQELKLDPPWKWPEEGAGGQGTVNRGQ
jgi:hypothetical protein